MPGEDAVKALEWFLVESWLPPAVFVAAVVAVLEAWLGRDHSDKAGHDE